MSVFKTYIIKCSIDSFDSTRARIKQTIRQLLPQVTDTSAAPTKPVLEVLLGNYRNEWLSIQIIAKWKQEDKNNLSESINDVIDVHWIKQLTTTIINWFRALPNLARNNRKYRNIFGKPFSLYNPHFTICYDNSKKVFWSHMASLYIPLFTIRYDLVYVPLFTIIRP